MKHKTKLILLSIVWAIWLTAMFFLLTQRASDSAKVSGSITQFILRLLSFINIDNQAAEFYVRKLAHFSAFAGSGFLGIQVLNLSIPKAAVQICVPLHALLAILSELLQIISEGRCCSIRDMAIDFCGACLGILLSCIFLRIISRYNNKKERRHKHGAHA